MWREKRNQWAEAGCTDAEIEAALRILERDSTTHQWRMHGQCEMRLAIYLSAKDSDSRCQGQAQRLWAELYLKDNDLPKEVKDVWMSLRGKSPQEIARAMNEARLRLVGGDE